MNGLNRDLGKYPESGYVRCSKCGFLCNTSRDVSFPDGSKAGYGTLITTQEFDDTSVGFDNSRVSFDGDIDPTVVGGCPFCGTYLYNR